MWPRPIESLQRTDIRGVGQRAREDQIVIRRCLTGRGVGGHRDREPRGVECESVAVAGSHDGVRLEREATLHPFVRPGQQAECGSRAPPRTGRGLGTHSASGSTRSRTVRRPSLPAARE